MLFDWDSILITVLHDDDGVVVQDEYSYSLNAEQRMITFAGNKGDKGDPGEAATIQIGTVTTLPAGSQATVQNVGTEEDAIFNFGIPQGEKGDTGSDEWGTITGTLSDQTDLQDALNAKQNTLTFDDAPTDNSDNPVKSNGIYDALALKAPLASPALTGTPTAPTATSGTNTTQIATTAYVRGEFAKEILYFYNQSTSTTSTATTAFCTISDSRITADTVVLNCEFTVPSAITSSVTWTTAAGYITLKGICTSNTCKVNLVLGQKGN